ncbi:YtxH domain-containing protein [Pedobacter sp. MC2016-15]|uniref:YtxH domain-containing protein n=1 Tax=Pedobacter sp. MC2016-15 TaxID=2994473 RepID=UPI0022473969|nr:YtxH domain-containing protein [Pedobacter sp. MC2016-15]MCX2480522.1 YtxH domain-containing protein [Pedobacter sp. MC2016-15]
MKFRQTNHLMTSIALIAGIAVGAAIGALFAPKSGKETRRKVAGHLVEDLRSQTKEKADQLANVAEDAVDLAKTTIKNKGPKSRQVPEEPQI